MENLIPLLVVFLGIGIIKDFMIFLSMLKKWLRTERDGQDPKSPANVEKLKELLDNQSNDIVDNITLSNDKHMQSLLSETRKTNDLLFKFLLIQRFVAKASGINLPEGV